MIDLIRPVVKFLGMDTESSPHDLLVQIPHTKAFAAKAQLINGYHVGQSGNLDGTTVGASAAIRTWGGYPISFKTWACEDGHTYHLAYVINASGVCKIQYLVDTAVSSPTTLSAIANDSTTNNWYASFVVENSSAVYWFSSKYGVYKIYPNLASPGALSITSVTCPPSSFGGYANSRMWTLVGDKPLLRWSAIGAVERYYPLPEEVSADTYGVDYGYDLMAFGCKGNTAMGLYASDFVKLVWTQSDLFAVFGDGNDGTTFPMRVGDGYGMVGFNSWTFNNNCVYFGSTFEGGRYLGVSFGAQIPAGTEVIKSYSVSKNYTVTVFDAAPNIRKQCAMPTPDCQLNGAFWDTEADWETIDNTSPAPTGGQKGSRLNLDTTTKPGAIFSNPTVSVTSFTALNSYWVYKYSRFNGGYWDSPPAETGGHTYINAYDGDPATYLEFSMDPKSDVRIVNCTAEIGFFTPTGTLISKMNILAQAGDQYITPAQPIAGIGLIVLYVYFNGASSGGTTDTIIYATQCYFPEQVVARVKVSNFVIITGAGYGDVWKFQVGEITPQGGASVNAVTLLSNVKAVACASANQLGMFFVNFSGTGSTGGLPLARMW